MIMPSEESTVSSNKGNADTKSLLKLVPDMKKTRDSKVTTFSSTLDNVKSFSFQRFFSVTGRSDLPGQFTKQESKGTITIRIKSKESFQVKKS